MLWWSDDQRLYFGVIRLVSIKIFVTRERCKKHFPRRGSLVVFDWTK